MALFQVFALTLLATIVFSQPQTITYNPTNGDSCLAQYLPQNEETTALREKLYYCNMYANAGCVYGIMKKLSYQYPAQASSIQNCMNGSN